MHEADGGDDMALKLTIQSQEDFTGEFPAALAKSGLWRFNEDSFDDQGFLMDSSGSNRKMEVINRSGTTAGIRSGVMGNYIQLNLHDPGTEQSYLKLTNDGSIFQNIGDTILVGGWIKPTIYSIGNTYCPLFNTRSGPGQPIFYLSFFQGRPRVMLYNEAGSLILDRTTSPSFTFKNGGIYFIACIIRPNVRTAQYVIGDRSDGKCWVSEAYSFTGELNRLCTADIIMGMHAGSYWYAGGFDDWFLDTDSELTVQDLEEYFRSSYFASGGDSASSVDALTEPGKVLLKKTDGIYPLTGELLTTAKPLSLSGTGRIAITKEYEAGVTDISAVEFGLSTDLNTWGKWTALPEDGKIKATANYIRFRITLTTTDAKKTPKLLDIRIYDIPKAPYEKMGFARPVLLTKEGAWEAVLENAYDIIVTSEVNGEDTLHFKLPFRDEKRSYLENEKKIQIVDDIYKVRTINDIKDASGNTVTEVYAEAEFYDLTFSVRKEEKSFDAETAETAMAYALEGTEWHVGTVNVKTKRTWVSQEKNALSILRAVASLHGGDLVFDSSNRLVHLYTVSGRDSGALFAYRKNMKSIERVIDTRNLVTRLYAVGAEGMTFSDINGGKPYLEDFTYSNDVRISTLDCSSFTNPYQMKEFTAMRLAQYAKPKISYVLHAMDLSVLTGFSHEAWSLGDYVLVEDKELGISVTTRIVRREYNLQEPWNTVLELSTTLKNLGSSVERLETIADTLEGAGAFGGGNISDMVPFNHLKNSRADDGMAYWLNSGFEAVNETGGTGTAAFKAEGAAGLTKSMAQTVYPSNRKSYTLSLAIASENLEKLSDTSQVGVEVEIEYEDGSVETRFIDLY
jgi:phage minor structural protein